MPVHVTFHAVVPSFDAPAGAMLVPVLGPKLRDRETLTVGTIQNTEAIAQACIARIYTTEECVVDVGKNAAADAAKGEPWPAGKDAERYIPAGGRVSVIAAA